MKLFLIRHGEAVPGERDPRRPLTGPGRQEVLAAAAVFRDQATGVGTFWHSTKLRARQTAELFRDTVSPQGRLVEKTYLTPDSPINDIVNDIAVKNTDAAVVGHMPFLSRLASKLLTGHADQLSVRFPTAGVCVLVRDRQGGWQRGEHGSGNEAR